MLRRLDPGPRNLAIVLRAKAPGSLREEAERHAREYDDVRDRSVPSIGPRRDDHDLRNDERTGAHRPPPLRPSEEEDRGYDQQRRSQEPEHAQRPIDLLRQLRNPGNSQRLRGTHQMDEPVDNEENREEEFHESLG